MGGFDGFELLYRFVSGLFIMGYYRHVLGISRNIMAITAADAQTRKNGISMFAGHHVFDSLPSRIVLVWMVYNMWIHTPGNNIHNQDMILSNVYIVYIYIYHIK